MDSTNKFTIHPDGSVSSSNITKDGMIQFPFPPRGRNATDEDKRSFVMDVSTFVHFFKALRVDGTNVWSYGDWREGSWRLARVITTGMTLAGHTLSNDEETQLESDLITLDECIRAHWGNLEVFLLEYTYIALRNRRVRHEDAASMASAALGETIRPDAWRMRIKKWAEAMGLPPVAQRLRKPQA